MNDELTGTWRTELSPADWAEAGLKGPAGTWTLAFADGQVTQPDGEIGYQARSSTFRGSLVTSGPVDLRHVAYGFDGDHLHLSDVTAAGEDNHCPYGVVWATHPCSRRIG